MAVAYAPQAVRAGVLPQLPYAVVPPFRREELVEDKQLPPQAPARWTLLLQARVLLPLMTVYAFLGCYLHRGPRGYGSGKDFGVVVFACFMAWSLSFLGKATLPRLLISFVILGPVMGMFLPAMPLRGLVVLCYLAVFGGSLVKWLGGDRGGRQKYPVASFQDTVRPVWGLPGESIAKVKEFGSAAAVGSQGEKLLGKALEDFARKYPFVRVFHTVHFVPNSATPWDVDHVVVVGGKVFLLDAKFWKLANYAWVDAETVYRNGEEFTGGKVHMKAALDKWRVYLPRFVAPEVRAFIVLVQGERPGRAYGVSNVRHPEGLELTTLASLMGYLEEVAVASKPVVDRRVVALVRAQLQ